MASFANEDEAKTAVEGLIWPGFQSLRIGMNDLDVEMDWRWIDGFESTWTNWFSKPDEHRGLNCAKLGPYTGEDRALGIPKWSDYYCYMGYPFICKVEKTCEYIYWVFYPIM